MQKFFVTCPKGLEGLLAAELTDLGADNVKETVAGAAFEGRIELAMRVCLWSRFASRVLMELSSFYCEDDSDLYVGASSLAWEKYFTAQESIAVEFSGVNKYIRNTQYGAVKVKDGICDHFMQISNVRPNVDKRDPDIRVYAHLGHGEASLYLDLAGDSLHQREFHRGTGSAPLKENLAAAMVVRAGYAEAKGNFLDPMCGSGTLLLEAASLLTDTAPGLQRTNFGFLKLKDLPLSAWHGLVAEAHLRSARGIKSAVAAGIKIAGFDQDSYMQEVARSNAAKAGFAELITIGAGDVRALKNPFAGSKLPLTIVTNPPYGHRMGNFNELIALYSELGLRLREGFAGATAAIISTEPELLSCIRMRADKVYKLYNGALECQLRVYKIADHAAENAGQDDVVPAEDFANRLKKNLKTAAKLKDQLDTDALRVYDADLPDYNAAIDQYGDFYVVQEYAAPASIPDYVARARLLDLISALIRVTGVPGDHIIVKSRVRQKGSDQYARNEDPKGNFFNIHEGSWQFRVNLEDYLDTGIFLDARPIRALISSLAKGKRFLNLFAYTGTAGVAAAKGGAVRTVNVDMSRTYLDWAMQNYALNGISLNDHAFIQADCLRYVSQDQAEKFDLIYVDPPTFSNSKRMASVFEVNRDHAALLGNLTRMLADGGTVIFCTNKRGFKLDPKVAEYGFTVSDISAETLPPDFARDAKIHACFKLEFNAAAQSLQPEPMAEGKAPRWAGKLEFTEDEDTWSRGEAKAGRPVRGRPIIKHSREEENPASGFSPYGSGSGSYRSEERRNFGDRKFGEKRAGGFELRRFDDRKFGEKREGGFERKGFGDRKFGEKREGGFGRKDFGDRKFGEKREGSFGRKDFGDRKFGEKREGGFGHRDFGDRKFGEKREGGFGRKDFGDRKLGEKREGGFERRDFGDRKFAKRREGGFERRDFSDRKFGNRRDSGFEHRKFGDRRSKPAVRIWGPDGVEESK